MVVRKRTGRKRTGGTGRKRGARGGRTARQQAGQRPKLTRLLRANVLTNVGATSLDATTLKRIETLSNSVIDKLIEARRRTGRHPNCWLI